ncbi:MAG: AAA family ATPase [Pseudomonadota bacterium]
MPSRTTKEKTFIRLPEQSIQKIESLVASWTYDTKAFVRSRLNQYKPPNAIILFLKELFFLVFLMKRREKKMNVLNNPGILTDWKKRFLYSGETNPGASWNKIIEKELTRPEYLYLIAVLDRDLTDIHVPYEFEAIFEKIYRAHIRREHIEDPDVPKAPIVLIEGTSGSGKSATVRETLEKVIFRNEVIPTVDWKTKKEKILANHSLFTSLEEVDPEFAMKIATKKKQRFYSRLSRIPILRFIFKKSIMKNLKHFEERGMKVDSSVITPNDYQTALSGEPGNFFKRAMGHPKVTCIRHIEEAHSAFGKSDSSGGSAGVEKQQRTLIDTSNIVLDEIIEGRRDCFLIATSDQTHNFDSAIYRRFVEKGCIIDMSNYWMNKNNLKTLILLEINRHQIPTQYKKDSPDLDLAAQRIYDIFKERTLKISPAYVRKLIESIINIRGDFILSFLENSILIRSAFQLVAKNVYGELYNKVVDRMDRTVKWEEYVGDIKDKFSEMANNCFNYGVSEDKGVVLTGPPGSGKTFLARTWLSSNPKVHDIATSPSALQDPASPIHGAVANLERVYDIAKMVAPTVIFFDEGDALAPRRSGEGRPSDALTNKFLNIIDGEIPLNKVFTVLTTNRLDILDPALIRSKRLKTLEISGHMQQKDIIKIIEKQFDAVPHRRDVDLERIIETAQSICNTPADYTSFTEKAIALCSTEYKVLVQLRRLKKSTELEKCEFVKLNFKTVLGILDAVKAPPLLKANIKTNLINFVTHYNEILEKIDHIVSEKEYPLVEAHLASARKEISSSPVTKGAIQLNEYLETELSKEPQVGFIIGVGANDVTGMLLPIATSLTGRVEGASPIIVTGAVSSSSSNAAELDMAVQMTRQSAQEALTMVKNYIQELAPDISIPWIFGDFLKKYSLHHQLLSASYNVGGPSAGFALAINTLSALLRLPLCFDFGITGAPWTKGVRKNEVGGSVIIGGHTKKSEKVLLYLRRMYMPLQNYKDLEPEFLMGYWLQHKDIIAVTHFADLMPEVLFLDKEHDQKLEQLIEMRIKLKSEKYFATPRTEHLKEDIIELKKQMRKRAETEIVSRVNALRKYLMDPDRVKYISHEQIFKQYMDN